MIITFAELDLPNNSGEYISSADAGGTTNSPKLVALQTKE
jgi:hypothetical protein